MILTEQTNIQPTGQMISGLRYTCFVNPSVGALVYPEGTSPAYRPAPAGHTPVAYYRSANPVLSADTSYRRLRFSQQWHMVSAKELCRNMYMVSLELCHKPIENCMELCYNSNTRTG